MSKNFPRTKMLKRLFQAKERRRQKLARLPLEEKLKILIRMQAMAAGQGLHRSKRIKSVWKI